MGTSTAGRLASSLGFKRIDLGNSDILRNNLQQRSKADAGGSLLAGRPHLGPGSRGYVHRGVLDGFTGCGLGLSRRTLAVGRAALATRAAGAIAAWAAGTASLLGGLR